MNLQIDNADERLTPIGRRVGLVNDEHWEAHTNRQARLKRVKEQLMTAQVDSGHAFFASRQMVFRERPSFVALLRRPEVRLEELIREGAFETEPLGREDIASIETDIKYEGYVRQQDREIEKLRKADGKVLPQDLDYATMPGLSREIAEKLTRVRPQSIGQASRIPGMTPAGVSILLFHLGNASAGRKANEDCRLKQCLPRRFWRPSCNRQISKCHHPTKRDWPATSMN